MTRGAAAAGRSCTCWGRADVGSSAECLHSGRHRGQGAGGVSTAKEGRVAVQLYMPQARPVSGQLPASLSVPSVVALLVPEAL